MHRTYTKRAEETQKKEINRKKKKIFLTSVLQIPNRMLKIKVGKGRKEQEGETRIKCIVALSRSFSWEQERIDRPISGNNAVVHRTGTTFEGE